MQHRERETNSSAQNNKAGYQNGTMPSFQTSPGSVHSILMDIYVSGGSKETARHLRAFDIETETIHLV